MKQILQKLFSGQVLSAEECTDTIDRMMRGEAYPEEIAAFLAALAARGETVGEIVGAVRSLRAHCLAVPDTQHDLIDVCGTGGDGSDTFNISTACALVLASLGVKVAKHGNRAVSSRSGSADVLEALGLPVELDPQAAFDSLDKHHFAFFYAPLYHPSLRHVGPVRRRLGVRTLFNLLGPLANPAPVKQQILGCFAAHWVRPLAEALRELGSQSALVVHGSGGLDEISLMGPTQYAYLQNGHITEGSLHPSDFQLPLLADLSALQGGSPEDNARIIVSLFQGEKGPRRDAVVINAAAALVIARRCQHWSEAAKVVEEALDSGRALACLQALGAKL